MSATPLPPRDVNSDSDETAGLVASEFELGILKSERLRITLVVLAASCSLAVSCSMALFLREPFERMINAEAPFGTVIGLTAGFILYELVVRFAIGQVMARRIPPPAPARYANALVESAFPSVVLLVIGQNLPPAQTLATPVMLVYFVFIALSALRLDLRLSAFSGLMSGAGYFFVYLYFRDAITMSGLPTPFTAVWPHLGKAALLVVTGLVTGFVANEIRKRLSESVALVDERNRVMSMFGQHVSPQVVNKLLEQKGEWGSEYRHVCMMFLDIRNFTTFCEGKTPQEVVALLNHLFGFMVDIVNAHNGIINKFLGDGFMAIFGAPLSDGRDSANAVSASRAILARMEEERAAGSVGDTRIGIGLHAGQVMTGNVGSEARKEYTVIGDTVNLAARIEGLNKQYEAELLISDTVQAALVEAGESLVELESIGPVQVKGRAEPVHVYKVA